MLRHGKHKHRAGQTSFKKIGLVSFSISVVIPNYNGKNLLEQNLPSLYIALHSSGITDFEIIIADDCSKDDSVSFLKEKYKDIIVIENRENRGFSGNTNTGIFRAIKQLVLILNSDVMLTPGYFNEQLSYFKDKDTFGVMGQIRALDSEHIQNTAKYPGYKFGKIKSTINYFSKSNNSLVTLFLCGANALIDREKLLLLGGFDELFNPYYSEDTDLGIRAWRAGYKVYYNHLSVCRHPNSATIKKEPSAKVTLIAARNKMYLHYKHLHGIEMYWYFSMLFIKTSAKIIARDKIAVNAFYSFWGNFKYYRNSKRLYVLSETGNPKMTIKQSVKSMRAQINAREISYF